MGSRKSTRVPKPRDILDENVKRPQIRKKKPKRKPGSRKKAPEQKEEITEHDKALVQWAMASPSVCCVCRQGSGDGQGFLVCSVPGCATTVHSACYSTSTTVKQQSQWRCDRCSSKDPALAVCTLCSHKEGAILAIEGGTPWVHSICKDWILKLRDREARSVSLSAIFRVGSKTWEGECSVCNGKTGSKRNCDAAGCKSVLHATCAADYGLLEKDPDSMMSDPHFIYCKKHASSDPVLDPWAKWVKAKPGGVDLNSTHYEKPTISDPRPATETFLAKFQADQGKAIISKERITLQSMAEQHHRREEIRRLQKLIDAGDKAESTIKKENDSVVSATRRVKQLLIGVYDYLTDTQDPYRTKAAIHGAPAIGRIPPDNIDLSESIQNASSHMPTIFERPPSPQLAPRTACDVLPDANDMGIPTSPPPSTDYIHEETAVPEQLPNTQSKFTPLDKKGFTQANAQLNLTSNGVSDTAADTEKDLNPSTPPVSSGVLNGADAASFKKDPTLQVSAPLISNKDCNGAESAIPAIAPERTSQSKGMGTFESFLSRATSSGRPTIRPLPEYREAFLAAYEHALQQPQEDQSLKIDTSIARKRKRDTANHGSVGVCNICGVFEAANVQRKTPIARQLVNCSNCEKSFHMGCLDPPMKKRPPRGYAWRCLDCDTTPESESFPDSPDSEVTAPLPKRRRTAPERYE